MDDVRQAQLMHAIAGVIFGSVNLPYDRCVVLALRILEIVKSAATAPAGAS